MNGRVLPRRWRIQRQPAALHLPSDSNTTSHPHPHLTRIKATIRRTQMALMANPKCLHVGKEERSDEDKGYKRLERREEKDYKG